MNGVVIVAYLLEPLGHLLLDRSVWTAAGSAGATVAAGSAGATVAAGSAGATVAAGSAGATVAAGSAGATVAAGSAGARVRVIRARGDREKKAEEEWNDVSVLHFQVLRCLRKANKPRAESSSAAAISLEGV
ncbi:hypothetical protein ACMHYB_25915 [Sorangium sp. So ce1128]